MYPVHKHIVLLAKQDSSATLTDRINLIYSHYLLQEAVGIRNLPEREEERQKYGFKLIPNNFYSKIHIKGIMCSELLC